MKALYPNLELLEYKFITTCNALTKNKFKSDDIEVRVFRQLWGSTATGFDDGSTMSGSAMTYSYTSVFMCKHDGKLVCGVFFGNRLGYTIFNPNDNFIEDLRNNNMAGVSERYKYETHNL